MKFPTISALLLASFSCVTSTAMDHHHRVLVHARAPATEYNDLRLRKRQLQDVDDNSPSVDDTPDINSVDDASDASSVDDASDTPSVDDENDSVEKTSDNSDSADDTPDTNSIDDASDTASADTNPSADDSSDTPSVDNPSADDPSVDDSSDNDSVDGTSSSESTSSTQEGTSVLQMQEVSSSFRPLFMQATAIAAGSVVYFLI